MNAFAGKPNAGRRSVLIGGGALVFSAALPLRRGRARDLGGVPETGVLVENPANAFSPNAFVRVTPSAAGEAGEIVMVMPNVEMGQGIYTQSVVLIAEELDVDPVNILLEAAPPSDVYMTAALGTEATGGSTSTMSQWDPLRQAGAAAREMLKQAAAARWGCSVDLLKTENGKVLNTKTGQSLFYGEVASEAALLTPPKDVPLRPSSEWKLIGHARHRLDSRIKVEGRCEFGIDVIKPGMKIGTVSACPVMGGRVKSMDRAAALAVPGVCDVLKIDNAVCVVADNYYAAHKGLKALFVQWDEGENAHVDTALIYQQLHDGLNDPKPLVAEKHGDAPKALAGAAKTYEAIYQQPLLAHSPMEPINCALHIRKDGADVWVSTQVPLRARDAVAEIAGLPKESVTLSSQYIGGGFGRRLEHEYVAQAAMFAKQVPYPLKIVWSREEDIQLDRYRPAYVDRVRAGLDEKGDMTSIVFDLVGPAVCARWAPAGMTKEGFDPDLAVAIAPPETPYYYKNFQENYIRRETPGVVTAWWRGVGGTRGLFVIESFMDELALLKNVDPLEWRRRLISHEHPRARGVLDLVAEKSGWGKPLPPGHGRGVCLQFVFGSYMATVATVNLEDPLNIKVVSVDSAVDCGEIVNPDQVIAQIEGGVIFGLGTALFDEITLKNGRVQESNFSTWRIIRMNEAPPVKVHLVQSHEKPGGIGECGTAAIAPAVANAIAAATGRRLRTLPLMKALHSSEGEN